MYIAFNIYIYICNIYTNHVIISGFVDCWDSGRFWNTSLTSKPIESIAAFR